MTRQNALAWLYGSYVQQAVASVLSKKVSYPKQPRSMGGDKLSDTEKFKIWADAFNKQWERTHDS